MTSAEEATREKRSRAAKRAAKKRAATKKAERVARRKEARSTPLVLADLDKLRAVISELTGRVQAIDRRVGTMDMHVATLHGHVLIKPASVLHLVHELAQRLSIQDLERAGLRLLGAITQEQDNRAIIALQTRVAELEAARLKDADEWEAEVSTLEELIRDGKRSEPAPAPQR